ncbi:hypothetical protein [Pseudoalteromonas sp. SMN1298-MNA-CIBAN-0114]|uniref:hypothetical protein n=1 Tax=Pseudoalteromonas sp. SMN1298-MNA-CIBAN-0114 TaxID=3140428 RepID=UPI003331DD82
MANTAINYPNQAPLKEVTGRHIPKGLAEIKVLMGTDRHTPEHVYNRVLTNNERTIICFTAGIQPMQQKDNFRDYSGEVRIKIHKAILQLQALVKAFTDANAMAPAKFVQHAPVEPANTNYSHLTITKG